MQCFERQAMYLKLYADAVKEIPGLEFDPNALDDLLSEFKIDRFSDLVELDHRQRDKIVKSIQSVTDVAARCQSDRAVRRDPAESQHLPEFGLPNGMPTTSPTLSRTMLY
jgi:hypothetical protein